MYYLGGKARICRDIAGLINVYRAPGQPYWEPFLGAGWVAQHVNKIGPNYFSDVHAELMTLWARLQTGWTPPAFVSRDMYKQAQAGKLCPSLTAFIGFGCSYAGKYFGGYADNGTDRNYARGAQKSLLAKIARIGPEANLFGADFLTAQPPAENCLIYCDPPYKGQTPYKWLPDFDHEKFWARARALSQSGHVVLISEYEAPADARQVWAQGTKTDLHGGADRNGGHVRVERLFTFNDLPVLQEKLL